MYQYFYLYLSQYKFCHDIQWSIDIFGCWCGGWKGESDLRNLQGERKEVTLQVVFLYAMWQAQMHIDTVNK